MGNGGDFPRGTLLRVLLLVAFFVGVPWLGRSWLGTVSWRELTERTRERLVDLALAAGRLPDAAVGGEPDFDQAWGVDYSAGPARNRTRITFRTGGSGSARLSVEIVDVPTGPEATIRIDHLGSNLAALRKIAAGLVPVLRELDVTLRGIEERELVRLLHGESFEVPAGRTLTIHEIGMLATGTSSSFSSELVVSVGEEELLRQGFGGTYPSSGTRLFVGDDLESSRPAVRPVLAGERVSLLVNSGKGAYLLGLLGPP